ncbi:hypothetical protein AB0O75_45200 [Streptomyces sp. NPDC088921]|uniref:hypothetical protein n=1 Tax=unclassified Streptomyces TaxID=2593676 RepID=UPI003443F548
MRQLITSRPVTDRYRAALAAAVGGHRAKPIARAWDSAQNLRCDHARRNVRDYETLPEHAETMLTIAAITLMTRRCTRQPVYPSAAKPRAAEAVAAA